MHASPLNPCFCRYLGYNQITALPQGIFQSLTSLRQLSVLIEIVVPLSVGMMSL